MREAKKKYVNDLAGNKADISSMWRAINTHTHTHTHARTHGRTHAHTHTKDHKEKTLKNYGVKSLLLTGWKEN